MSKHPKKAFNSCITLQIRILISHFIQFLSKNEDSFQGSVRMNSLESNDHNLDRLSALPDSLIHEILSLLKMRDVVRTTLLSKQWNNLWVTTHCLQFEENDEDPIKIRNFVSGALTLWRGTQLQKFSIDILSADDTQALSSDIDLWVRFATERNVEELHIGYMYSVGIPLYYRPPQCFYECSSLRKLSLDGCNLRIHGGVQWNRLSSLDLSFCHFHEDVLNQILASSTQLETVTLVDSMEDESLSIRSSSLKKLLVFSICDRNLHYAVTIYASNMEALQFIGAPFNKYLPSNFSSWTEVLLDLTDLYYQPVLGEALCQILPAIQPVVTVKLTAFCLKMLGVVKGKLAFSPLLNVKLLRIGGGLAEIRGLVGLLEVFPKLKTLIVDWEYDEKLFEFNGDIYTMSESNILTSNLLQLRRVEIVWTRYQASIFQFIECILKHAPMIQKMEIQKREFAVDDSKDMFQAAQKVVSLQNSLPSVELILRRCNMNYSACFRF